MPSCPIDPAAGGQRDVGSTTHGSLVEAGCQTGYENVEGVIGAALPQRVQRLQGSSSGVVGLVCTNLVDRFDTIKTVYDLRWLEG